MSLRFLVLGVSGMAGHVIARYLQERGYDVTGFSRRPTEFAPTLLGDATDQAALRELVRGGQFDVVVNAIGILNADAENNESLAMYLNGDFPHLLAEISRDMSTRVIHMSTDCVFAGNTGPYTETSVPDGESVYDRSKARGELNDEKNITLRNSIIGPDINKEGIGLFNWFMGQRDTIYGFKGALWTGMTTIELARAMEHVAVMGDTGLVNMVPPEAISKYDLLRLFKKHFRGDDITVVPDENFVLDKTLVRMNFDSSFRPKPYEEQVADMAQWVRDHADLYPHYNLEAMLDA